MGLFAKLMGTPAVKKEQDDVLLLHGMLLMAGADGSIEAKELATVSQFLNTLPEFQGKDIKKLFDDANKLVAKHGGLKASTKALLDIQSDAIRKKCFVLCADIALSSGDVDEQEDALLEKMKEMLKVDDELAGQVIKVLALKYAK